MSVENIYQHALKEGITKQQLCKDERFHVLHLTLKKGESLKTHTSSTDAFLLMMEGDILFTIHEKEYCLKKGDIFTFKEGEQHAVHAATDASFLLVK